ncbi:MAG: SCO family protein [Bacteroidota bacterium]
MQIARICCIGILISCTIASCKQTAEQQQERVLPFYSTADFTPQWKGDITSGDDTVHRIPSFHFIDQNGAIVSEKTFSGKIYVANFFFTSCPGICKRLTNNLALVQTAFQNDPELLLLSHSVTPETDSVPVLAKYAKAYGVLVNKWHMVTGNRDSIYTIARKAYFADEDMGQQKKSSSDFLHTENIVLIDKQRRIRGVYKGTSVRDIDNLIADIKVLKMEQ